MQFTSSGDDAGETDAQQDVVRAEKMAEVSRQITTQTEELARIEKQAQDKNREINDLREKLRRIESGQE